MADFEVTTENEQSYIAPEIDDMQDLDLCMAWAA